MYEKKNGFTYQLSFWASSQTVLPAYETAEDFCFFWGITNLSRSDGRRPSHFIDGTVRWWASKDIDWNKKTQL